MIEDFWIIEVFYNESGLLYDPNAQVRTTNRYHSLFKPAMGRNLEDVETKIRAWFEIEKPEYKIIKMQSHRTLL